MSVRDVQSAVDELGASLAHPVLVEDARHRPIGWSAQGQVDGTRMRTILQHEVDPAARAVVARLGLARASGPVRTPAAPEADVARSATVDTGDSRGTARTTRIALALDLE